MKTCDLLQNMIDGKLTNEQAEDVCSDVLADTSSTIPAHEMLGMSRIEWTAYCHGAEFQDIANWRFHGWPSRCFTCGQWIVVDNFGWLARKHEGRMQLEHIVCPID